MRITKTEIPTKIDVPGAVARQLTSFGDASDYGTIAVEDAEVILFSPQRELLEVMDHMLARLGG